MRNLQLNSKSYFKILITQNLKSRVKIVSPAFPGLVLAVIIPYETSRRQARCSTTTPSLKCSSD